MTPQILNTIGLSIGILGVLLIFIWGPPQPNFDTGVSLGLEDGTPIDEEGKTVADYSRETEVRRKRHRIMSRVGLGLVLIGFSFQLWAVWIPTSTPESRLSPSPATSTSR